MSDISLTCEHCGKPKKRMYPTRSKYCLKCTWPVRHPLARKAIAAVHQAVNKGLMPKARGLDCIDCGSMATEYDHRDYTKPLEVDPVCHSCNLYRGPAHPYHNESARHNR